MAYHIAKARSFVAGLSHDEFLEDDLRFYAATRCLEIISEASRRLPDELKARHPSVPWQDMAGAGNVYRHDYDHVAPGRVWTTVVSRLPPLAEIVDAELAALG